MTYDAIPLENNRDHGAAGLAVSSVAVYSKRLKCLWGEMKLFSKHALQDLET